jgi:hypothetical protein
MKYYNLCLIFFLFLCSTNCKEKIENEPSFIYDCSDTVFHYNVNNELTRKGIRFYKSNLLVRSEDSEGFIEYFNYDHKNRVIKEGRINNGYHYWVEYIYDVLDTISEVRCSDNTKTYNLYNENRKLIESKTYENNILIFQQNLTYSYYNDVELIKYEHYTGNIFYEFNISNCVNLPIEIDTINSYRLRYITGLRLDSLFQYQNYDFLNKEIYKYNYLNLPIYEEHSSYSFSETQSWEYSQTNKITSYIYKKENSNNPYDNFYRESQHFYNQEDELFRIEYFYSPNVLEGYTLVNNDGYYVFWNYYSADSTYRGFSKFSPSCLNKDLKNQYLNKQFILN